MLVQTPGAVFTALVIVIFARTWLLTPCFYFCLHGCSSQEDKLGKQEVTEITKDMTMGPLDAFKKKMGF